jgi:hypothetical protein
VANARAIWHLKTLGMDDLKSALLWAKALPDAKKGTLLGALILSLRAMEDPALAWTEQGELFDGADGPQEPALVQSGKRIARQLWERDPALALSRLSALKDHPHLNDGAYQAGVDIAASPEGRGKIHHAVAQVPDDATRALAATQVMAMSKSADNLPWLMGLPFSDEATRQRLLTSAIWKSDTDGVYDPVLTKWLATLPPETAAAHRAALRAALLSQPDDWRLRVSRRITDPELRRAVQESL